MDILFIILISVITVTDAQHCKHGVIRDLGVSQKDMDDIVHIHNYYRALAQHGKVPGQPKALFIPKLSWDYELAATAQKIAETCVFKHVPVEDSRFQVGQNLYTIQSSNHKSGFSWLSAIRSWYDEYTTYVFGQINYNHYTQLVWANTVLVGCGSVHFRRKDGWHQKLYICNYGPGGNVPGLYPYLEDIEDMDDIEDMEDIEYIKNIRLAPSKHFKNKFQKYMYE